jgi:hypothetical protein
MAVVCGGDCSGGGVDGLVVWAVRGVILGLPVAVRGGGGIGIWGCGLPCRGLVAGGRACAVMHGIVWGYRYWHWHRWGDDNVLV